MTGLTVIDTGCDDMGCDNIAGRIVAGIRDYGGSPTDYRVVQAASYRALKDRITDFLVVSEEGSKICGKAPWRVKCGILLLPGDIVDCGGDAEGFDAECIVTYGMSPKNTITLSSIGEESCVLAVQRELLTIGGDMLERQEMKIRGGMRPSSLLAVAGTLLILGLKISVP